MAIEDMGLHRAYTAIAIVLMLCSTASAQVLQSVDRELLDAMVKPTLSTEAAGAVKADSDILQMGTISDGVSYDLCFVVRNTSTRSVAITELRSSCSCLKLKTRPTLIKSGEQRRIEATFDPAGRSGEFSLNIDLYTSLDEGHPTERLTITGRVERSDKWSHLPESMGELRLSRRAVTIEHQGRERIIIANSGTTPLHLAATTAIEGLRLYTTPEVIAPGDEGEMIVEYRGTPIELNTTITIEGISGSASQRRVEVTIKR